MNPENLEEVGTIPAAAFDDLCKAVAEAESFAIAFENIQRIANANAYDAGDVREIIFGDGADMLTHAQRARERILRCQRNGTIGTKPAALASPTKQRQRAAYAMQGMMGW